MPKAHLLYEIEASVILKFGSECYQTLK